MRKKRLKQVFALLTCGAVTAALCFPCYVTESHSMEGTLRDGDVILACSVFSEIKRGDIVVVVKEGATGERKVVKRVIGIGGDTVEVKGILAYLNGEILCEPYLYEPMKCEELRVKVPEGYLFIMGDNRNVSVDSRSYGCISTDSVESKVIKNLSKR